MYLKLKDICYYFEKIGGFDYNYFNIHTYQICSQEEMQIIINDEIQGRNDFILIPQIDRCEIVENYLRNRNDRKMINHVNEIKSGNFRLFHWYIEDNNLTDDWNSFEKDKLISFAANWCLKNAIKYTTK